MLSTPNLLRLSQGQLNLLQRCPRQFQYTYLEQLYSPSNPEHEERQTLGSRFHLLMQQREMGLPIDTFLQADSQLQTWMTAFANAAPEILAPTKTQIFRESEHYRTLQVQQYLLSVVYDLLIVDNQQAQIFDWKTYPKPPNKPTLEQNWQTRLYMYVLAETSEFLPKNISMTYWFVQSQGKPQFIKFNYSSTQHQKTAQKLNQLLNNLTKWLLDYQIGQEFPQIPSGSKTCDYCQYNTKCDYPGDRTEHLLGNRPELATPDTADLINAADSNLLNLASIQEISL